MSHSHISKALVIASLVASTCFSTAFAGQELATSQTEIMEEDSVVITQEQQQQLDMRILSWQQAVVAKIQEKNDNQLIYNENIDYHQDAEEISVEFGSVNKRMVQN